MRFIFLLAPRNKKPPLSIKRVPPSHPVFFEIDFTKIQEHAYSIDV
jgi:hypothetical protein